MPSVIQRKSYNSARVFWLNKDLLKQNIYNCINELASKCPEAQKIILFGSAVNNSETVTSDIDIILIVTETQTAFLDRPLIYKEFFKEIGLEVDIFVYTKTEIEKENIPLLRSATKFGKTLFER
ncbi:MAG: nucleotidyltransferase domain-containing protein [Candidatus Omnitrophota bacterium]